MLVVGLLVIGRATGITQDLDVARLRAAVEGAGALGVLLYVAAFTAGVLVHVPGWVFVAAAVACYGRLGGSLLALGAGILAVTVTFWVVRFVGGAALAEVRSPLMRRLLAPLDVRPVTTVFLLRTIFMVSPPVTYALALSRVRFRDFLVGSAVGLVGPIFVASFVFDRVLG